MHPPRGSQSRYRAGYLLLCRIMHPRALLIQHLGSLQGVLWLANTQQKEKQKALLGKRVRVGDSCYSSVWYSQRLVGAVEQRGTGGLCSAGCEGRSESVKSRASKSVQSHSKRGQWKLGARRKDTWATGVYPTDRLRFFRLKNWRAALQEPMLFLPCWSCPYQQQCAHSRTTLVWTSLAHTCLCASENLLLSCIMIGVTSAVLLVNAGRRRSQKEHHKLWLRLLFFSVCKGRLLPSLLSVSAAPPLLPQHHPLPISNTLGGYRC